MRSRCGWSTSSTGEGRDLTPDLDLWPHGPVWAPDSSAVYFVADENGRAPAFRVDVASGEVTRLSAAGAFSDLCPSPDGAALYALRATMASPAEAVALDTTTPDQEPRPIPTPGLPLEVPGRVEEMTATASDGTADPLLAGAPGRRLGGQSGAAAWSGSTAARSAPGTAGTGGGTPG